MTHTDVSRTAPTRTSLNFGRAVLAALGTAVLIGLLSYLLLNSTALSAVIKGCVVAAFTLAVDLTTQQRRRGLPPVRLTPDL